MLRLTARGVGITVPADRSCREWSRFGEETLFNRHEAAAPLARPLLFLGGSLGRLPRRASWTLWLERAAKFERTQELRGIVTAARIQAMWPCRENKSRE